MLGGHAGAEGLRRSRSPDEASLEKRLLPPVAERARSGLVLLAVASLFPVVGDYVVGAPDLLAMEALEVLRVAAFLALAWKLRGQVDDTRASRIILLAFVVLVATTASISIMRADIGPYMIVTIALVLSAAVGVPWSLPYQAAAAALVTGGLLLALHFSFPDSRWTIANANTLFAYFMGMLTSVLTTAFDVQRRRAAREALDRTLEARRGLDAMNESLEQRVEQRTRELAEANRALARTNERLATSNRDLEAAYGELEGFTRSMSHDLRVPLRVINGLSRVAAEEHGPALGDEGRNVLDRIAREAVRVGAIADDLLTLARVTRAPINRTDVDVTDLARRVGSALAAASPSRRIALHVEAGLRADAEPELLRVVVEQLLSNAWKFTHDRAEAEVRVAAASAPGMTGFEVRDNGCGFDPGFAGKLFQPFERIHDDDAVEGRGIGLAIAHRIVTRHGGTIEAEGQVGGGASFRVLLPAGPAAGATAPSPRSHPSQPGNP